MKLDWLIVVLIITILIAYTVVVIEGYKIFIDKCASDPIGYASKTFDRECYCMDLDAYEPRT